MKDDMLDVVIIGAGPIGLACGIEAEKKQLSYRIIEKGCLVNSLYHFPVNMTFFSTSQRLEIGNVPFISHGDKPTRGEALEYYRRVKPDIENRIKEGSIAAYFNAFLKEIRGKEVDIERENQLITIENDFVLAMTGYHPDYHFLKQVGIDFNKDDEALPCFNPETFETNLKGIYLAGVVCGGMNTSKWFIENAREHPQKIFDHITANK
jgi:thioredoxin reductase